MTDDEQKIFTIEKKKLASMGPDFVVIIPRKAIEFKLLDPNKLYDITFKEVQDE